MRFLIVKTSSLGDIIHAFPALGYLRAHYPAAQIDWVVERPFEELVVSHPYVDRALCISTKMWRKGRNLLEFRSFRKTLQELEYDAVFDLQGNTKSGLITFLASSSSKIGFGKPRVTEWPNLLFTHKKYSPPLGINVRDENLLLIKAHVGKSDCISNDSIPLKVAPYQENKLADLLMQSPLQGPLKVMVCLGSAWLNKQITLEACRDFLRRMREKLNATFLFTWGNESELASAKRVQKEFVGSSIVIDRMPLPVLQNLMGRVNLVIAMDSLPLHLAGTTGTPTFGVFGASSSQKYNPIGSRHHALQGGCPYGRVFERRCPILRTCQTGLCIRGLTGAQLFESFFSWYTRHE